MGYNERPGLVEEWQDVLEDIRRGVEKGETVVMETEDPGRDAYRIRRALKASEVYRNECGGRYAGLGSVVKLSTGAGKVEIAPRGGAAHLHAQRLTEFDALVKVQEFTGTVGNAEFYPSDKFNPEQFVKQVAALGYQVERIMTPADAEEAGYEGLSEGQVNVLFSRDEPKVDPYARFGFRKSES